MSASKFIQKFKISQFNLLSTAAIAYNFVIKFIKTDDDVMPFLFYGKPGTGKSETAKRLAQWFTNSTIENTFHIAGSTVGIDTIKSLLENFQYLSLFGNGKKALIIEELDSMSKPAQDLLLHLIDIATKDTLIIATSNNFDKLQDRLQSRFITFEFLPPKIEDIAWSLESFVHIPQEIAKSIAIGCNGDFRQAINDAKQAKMLIDMNAA